MFGTVARYLLKPGHEKQFMDEMGSFEEKPPEGWVYHTMFRSTKDPNELWLSVVFESEALTERMRKAPRWIGITGRCSSISRVSRSGTTATSSTKR
jgi:hypothetical protein